MAPNLLVYRSMHRALVGLVSAVAFAACAAPDEPDEPVDTDDTAEIREGKPGSLDKSFGDRGLVKSDFGLGAAFAWDAEGRLVVAYNPPSTPLGRDFDFALRRATASAERDPTFGGGGAVRTDLGGVERVDALAIVSGGKILVGGSTDRDGVVDFAVARYLPDGELDRSFGSGRGFVTFDGSGDDVVSAFVERGDGRILAVGRSNGRIAVAQLDETGALDATFGDGGIASTDLVDAVRAAAIDEQGRLVVARCRGAAGRVSLTRFTASGRVDSAFGSGGSIATSLLPPLYDHSRTQAPVLSLRPDGRILIAGVSARGDDRDFTVIRFDASGRPDPTFGRSGTATYGFDDESESVSAMAVDEDGRILVVGNARRFRRALLVLLYENEQAAILRLLPDGTVDRSFGKDGRVLTDYGGDHEDALDIRLLPGGRMLTVGSSLELDNPIIARYHR
jgi:uncharacterized delta-60 repeat protein